MPAEPVVSESISALADRLLEAREAMSAAKAVVEYLQAQLDGADHQLAQAMLAADIQRFTKDERTFYRRLVVSVTPIEKDTLYAWLKVNGHADLVTETVPAKTLSSWYQELPEEKQLQLVTLVKVYEAVKVGVRKGG